MSKNQLKPIDNEFIDVEIQRAVQSFYILKTG